MIKHLKDYVLDHEISSTFVLNSIDRIREVLSRSIDGLNIVGTSHPYFGVQVYGWQSPLPDHIDKTGYVFIMPIHISTGTDRIICADTKCDLKVGNLYLLDDKRPHRTEGNGSVIALFMGSYKAKALNDDLYQRIFNQFAEHIN